MKTGYTKRFLRDLAIIPENIRGKMEKFVFEDVPATLSIMELGKIEKIKGYSSCYKVRFGDYRIGIRYVEDTLIFERVLHRKEIYRYFP